MANKCIQTHSFTAVKVERNSSRSICKHGKIQNTRMVSKGFFYFYIYFFLVSYTRSGFVVDHGTLHPSVFVCEQKCVSLIS